MAALVLLGVAGWLAWRSGGDDLPPRAGEFVYKDAADFRTFSVQRVAQGKVTLAPDDGGQDMEVDLPDGMKAEVIRPAAAGSMAPGMPVSIIGVPNEVRNVSIRTILAMPGGVAAADGLPRTPGGWAGFEASTDPKERPFMGGTVAAPPSNVIELDTKAGRVNVELFENAPVRLLAQGGAGDIHEGDRIALRTGPDGTTIDLNRTALVLAGGAR